ncbi:MAG: chemotaxis-specific protein-glutamate methyltransferase CheB [Xenococcaceae cyanobacterium]
MVSPIPVFLVEDSPIALAILERILQSSKEVLIVGTARNGKEALEKIPKIQPSVICTDLHMPKMDGLELTRQVMAKYPRPILVISNSVDSENNNNVFQLLQAGAVDFFPKPSTGMQSDYEQARERLIAKIKVLSGVKVLTKHLSKEPQALRQKFPSPSTIASTTVSSNFTCSVIKMLAIGASTGGPQALHKILSQLPNNFPVPIVCIQHISIGFLQGLVDWLSAECQLKVKIAEDGELPMPGYIYFAPEKHHLEFNCFGKMIYSNLPAIDGHCPSVTATFRSAAKFYGSNLAGVLLTGMGRDGAAGMQDIFRSGGVTIAQDEKSSVVFGMPKEAIALGAARQILPVDDIAPLLLRKIF